VSKILYVKDWNQNVLEETSTVEEAIQILNSSEHKIALVTNQSRILLGTITDGDVRRGLLKGFNLQISVREILNREAIIAKTTDEDVVIRNLMERSQLTIVPLVEDNNILSGLAVLTTKVHFNKRENLMLIMAGGVGSRLRPLTDNCPKPMINVGGKPMLEHILDRAKAEGFQKFRISVNYLAEQIIDYFGDGSKFNVEIEYLVESKPLGTAGSINLLREVPGTAFIVTNGDVISDIKYGEMVDYHSQNSGYATMAVRQHLWQNPFGVVETSDNMITQYVEKPKVISTINAGVYVLNPESINLVSPEVSVHMSEIILKILKLNKKVLAYPIHESWTDLGRQDDLTAFRVLSQQDRFR